MSTRFNILLSDELNRELDRAVIKTESSKSEVLRKALQLYLTALDGSRSGLKVGLIAPETQEMKTEIIGF